MAGSSISPGEEPAVSGAAVPAGEPAASGAAEPSGEPSGRSAKERLIDTREAARLLGMTERGVQLAAERGTLAYDLELVGLTYRRRFFLSDVLAYARERDAMFARRSRGPNLAEARIRAAHSSA